MWMETERRPATWQEANSPDDFTVRSAAGVHFGPWVGRLAEFMLSELLDEVSERDRPIVTVFYKVAGVAGPRMARGLLAEVASADEPGEGDLVFADGVRICLGDLVSFGL